MTYSHKSNQRYGSSNAKFSSHRQWLQFSFPRPHLPTKGEPCQTQGENVKPDRQAETFPPRRGSLPQQKQLASSWNKFEKYRFWLLAGDVSLLQPPFLPRKQSRHAGPPASYNLEVFHYQRSPPSRGPVAPNARLTYRLH